jgi:hypothetical protein
VIAAVPKTAGCTCYVARCRVRVRTVALASDIARQRAAGSAIGSGRRRMQQTRRNVWDVKARSKWSSVMPARSLALCRTRRGNANESSAAMQQSTVVGAVPAGARNSRTASGKTSTLHKNASWLQWWPCCMVVSSTWRQGSGQACTSAPAQIEGRSEPDTHMPEVPHDIYVQPRKSCLMCVQSVDAPDAVLWWPSRNVLL